MPLIMPIVFRINKEKRAFIWFISVGIIVLILYYTIFKILNAVLMLDYKLAISISYVVAVTCHFLMNKTFTFRRNNVNLDRQVIRYIVTCAINYLITIIVVELTVKRLLFPADFGLIASIFITVLSGYLLTRFWVFRHET